MTQLTFSENAAGRIAELKKIMSDDALRLRVYVTGGGCHGFQYGFSFVESVDEADIEIERKLPGDAGSVAVVVDPFSVLYLDGAEIDYEEGLQGSFFFVKNPNASSTCSCGASFSMDE